MKKSATKSKEFSSNKLILPLFFMLCTLLLDMVSFLYLGFYQTIPTRFLFNIGGAFIFAGIIYIMPGKKSALTFFYIFIVLQVVINILNANLYSVFGDLFSLDYFFLGAEGAAAIRWEFIDFVSIVINIGILGAIIFATVALFKWNKSTISLAEISTRVFALIFVLLFETCGVTIYVGETINSATSQSEKIEGNTSYLWDSFRFKVDAYKEFGYYGFYLKNVFDFFKFSNSLKPEEKKQLQKFVEDGKVEAVETEFSDDNLIVILCESHEWFAYDPILTPHVYDLMTKSDPSTINEYDATVFTNFYGHNKTNVSENIVLSGNMPKLNNLSSLVNAGNYSYAYTLPKLFEAAHEGEKVQTTYFHSFRRTFYHRDPNYLNGGLGFDKYISMENNSDKSKYFGDWISDADFISSFWEDFVPSDKETKFLTSFATISTHGPYTNSDNPRFKSYYEKYDAEFENYSAWVTEHEEELGYSLPKDQSFLSQLRRYKVGAMDFDNMIAKLFERLKETDHLNDTTVVMFADHNCYYDNLCYAMKGIAKDDYANIEAHHIPLMIYSHNCEPGEVNNFCNTYDIFPTLCQLYGFAYNKNLVQGFNMFEPEIENSFFASHMGGMFTEDFFSQNISDAQPLHLGLSDEDLLHFKEQAELYYSKQDKYEKIYLNNLT